MKNRIPSPVLYLLISALMCNAFNTSARILTQEPFNDQLTQRVNQSNDEVFRTESSQSRNPCVITEFDPEYTKDVGVESIDMLNFYNPGIIIPKATVKNFGTEPQSFDVNMAFGNYSSTVAVPELLSGQSLQVTFDTIESGSGSFVAEVCTLLPGDEYPGNDCMAHVVIVQEGHVAYAYLAEDIPGSLVEGPVMFNPDAPGGIVQLAPTTSDEIITGSCWYGGFWWGCQQGGGLYMIDHDNGEMTFFGDTPALTGLVNNGQGEMYGVSGTVLYEVIPLMGLEIPIGEMGNPAGQMMGIASDENGNLFGIDVGDDMLYSIDKTTGAATAIGPLGFDFDGPQDISFYRTTGQLYLAGYANSGGLYYVDVTTGAAYLFGEFPNGARIAGFTIPYDEFSPAVPPPGFTAEYVEDTGIVCSWGINEPGDSWLGYGDWSVGSNTPFGGGGTYYAAIRFDTITLNQYNDWQLTRFQFYAVKENLPSEITFVLWEDTNAFYQVYSQVVENINWNAWNTIELDEPHTIDAGKELWAGFMVNSPDGENPIGYDDGPGITGYGDLISFDGETWESLSTYEVNVNYNLKILVEEASRENLADLPMHSKVDQLKSKNDRLEYLGVNLYRYQVLLNTEPIPPNVQTYTDPFFVPGTWTYSARAVYDDGLSDPTPDIEVIIPVDSEISVSPDSLSEVHNNPPQITTRELIITNTGDEPLEWEIQVGSEMKAGIRQINFNADVGVSMIVEPADGPGLSDEEPITIRMNNYGSEPQSAIPWQVSYTGPDDSATFSGTWAGNLEPDSTVDITLDETLDMTTLGNYHFEACTLLAGDENPDNDCTSEIISSCDEYCYAGTETEDEWIANVLCGSIDNSSGWQYIVADYTDIYTTINAGGSEAITITNGNAWAPDKVTCWVDWNKNNLFDIGTNEVFKLDNVNGTGETFTGEISVPPYNPVGDYRMRVRMTFSIEPYPCGNSSYGEVEDYTIHVEGVQAGWLSVNTASGVIEPGETDTIVVSFDSEGLGAGHFNSALLIYTNSYYDPLVTVPCSLQVNASTQSLVFEPFEQYLAGDYLVQQAIGSGKEYWTTFSEEPGGTEDPLVSDFLAFEGFNSVVIEGANDAVLVLPEPISTDVVHVNFEVLIPSGKTGYFCALQAFDGVNSEWGMQCFFDVDGEGSVDAGGEGSGTFNYEYDVWHHVHLVIDLGNDLAEMYFNDTFVVDWQWSTGSFGTGSLNEFHALNFFAWNETGTPGAYFDNIDIALPDENPTPPPNDFMGWTEWDGFYLSWSPPGAFEPVWLTYSQGEITNSIGTNQAANFDVAARFPADQLIGFTNGSVTKINFVPGEPDGLCTYSLRIWQGSEPEPTLIYDEELATVTADTWNEIELANPVPFDISQDLWIGFNCNATGGYPAGCDDGPQDEGLGNMMYWDGEWTTLTSLNPDLLYNWAVIGYIESSAPGELPEPAAMIYPQQNTGADFTLCPQLIDPPAVFSPDNSGEVLLGYNVYEDGEILEELFTGTYFYDGDFEYNTIYEYYVTAVYDAGESQPTPSEFLWIPDAIEEVEGALIQIYPNPVYDRLTVQSESDILGIIMHDVNGNKVFEDIDTGKNVQINTSHFPPGIYTLQLETEKGISVYKVVVK